MNRESLQGRFNIRLFGVAPEQFITYNEDRTKICLTLKNRSNGKCFNLGVVDLSNLQNSHLFICFEEISEPYCISAYWPSETKYRYYYTNFPQKCETCLDWKTSLSQTEETESFFRLKNSAKFCKLTCSILETSNGLAELRFDCMMHASSHITLNNIRLGNVAEYKYALGFKHTNRFIFGDQFNFSHSPYKKYDPEKNMAHIIEKYLYRDMLDYHSKIKARMKIDGKGHMKNIESLPILFLLLLAFRKNVQHCEPLCLALICKYLLLE